MNKQLTFLSVTIIVRSVFEEDGKYYPQVFWDDQKSVWFKSHYWYFKDIGYKYEPHVCNKCHDLLTVVYDLKNFMILNIKNKHKKCWL